jgi:hypothetical protein
MIPLSDQTIDDRARAAFGQSLDAEEFAVRSNELAWKARRSRLQAFRYREIGGSGPAAHHERAAEAFEADLQQWIDRGVIRTWRAVTDYASSPETECPKETDQ